MLSKTFLNARDVNDFSKLKRMDDTVFNEFEDGLSFIQFMQEEGSATEKRDSILLVLIKIVQDNGLNAKLASSYIWCSVLLKLNVLYDQQVNTFHNDKEEILSDFYYAFAFVLRALKYEELHNKFHNISNYLVRSIERTLVKYWCNAKNAQARQVEVMDKIGTEIVSLESSNWPEVITNSQECFTKKELIVFIQEHCTPIIGDKVNLIIDVMIHGESQVHIAKRLGVKETTIRKRLQRSLEKLRESPCFNRIYNRASLDQEFCLF